MAELTPSFMDISSVYSGDELGLPYRDLVSEGVVAAAHLAVSERGAGPNLSVDVAAGAAWVLGDTNVDRQPCYRCPNDAVKNLGITPDPANPRKVLVVAQITDETFAGTGRNWALVAIHGTPAGAPTEPALPASALPLALVDVTAADASIANAQITDRRIRAGMGHRPLIHDVILAGAQATIDLPNIPGGFAHLELDIYARGDTALANTPCRLRFNGDTGANYDWEIAQATAAAPTGTEGLADTSIIVTSMPAATAAANRFGASRLLIPHYANAANHKIVITHGGFITGTATGNVAANTVFGGWRSTAAINRITLHPAAGNFAAGTRVTLYGLRV